MQRHILVLLSLVSMSSLVLAQKGTRQGVFLGLGAGGNLTIRSSSMKVEIPGIPQFGIPATSVSSDTSMTNAGLSMDFKIGFAPARMIAVYASTKTMFLIGSDPFVWGGWGCVGGSYYFQETSPSLFLSGGVGYSLLSLIDLNKSKSSVKSFSGFGFFVGAGYEFESHLELEGNFLVSLPGADVVSTPVFSGISARSEVTHRTYVFKLTLSYNFFFN